MVNTQPNLTQIQLTGWPGTVSQDLRDVSESTGQQAIGDIARTQDGRRFVYVYNGGVAAVVGKLYASPAEVTANENLAVAAAALGTNVVTTTATVTVTQNQYQFGFLTVSVTPGVGYMYPIQSHPAATSGTLAVTLNENIQVALTSSSTVSLVANPYNGVIVNPTTFTGCPVGVAVSALPINFYGWLQTWGAANVLQQGSVTVGNDVVASSTTAGAVTVQVAGSSSIINGRVGVAMQTGTATDYCPVFLQIS